MGFRRGDDLHQVRIGQQWRIFQNRRRNCFHVTRQRLHHPARHAIQQLDFFREDGADARQLVARQPFQGLDRQRPHLFAGVRRQVGHQAADFARKLRANFFVFVVREQPVGLRRRGGIGCHRTARLGRTFRRDVKEDLRRSIAPARQRLQRAAPLPFEQTHDVLRLEPIRQSLRCQTFRNTGMRDLSRRNIAALHPPFCLSPLKAG